MMKAIHTLIYSLFFMCPHFTLFAHELDFSQISSQNGLSQNTVRTIVEDKNGFIWAGTLDGLNRYDGYDIRSYQPQLGNPNSLDDHRVRDLYVDREGYLWVKTYRNEFSCYNPLTDSFIHIKDNENERFAFSSYYESASGDIWLWGLTDGVTRIRRNEKAAFVQDKFISKNAVNQRCHFVFEDSNASIWLGGNFGLHKISGNSDVQSYYTNPSKHTFIQATEQNGKIYFATQESTLIIYDLEKGDFQEIESRIKNTFENMVSLSDRELLIITQSLELWLFDITSQEFRKSELNGKPELSQEIRTYVDKNKGVWLYNFSGIMWYHNRQKGEFKSINLIPKDIAKLTDIGQIFVDSDNLVWFITYGCGLFCYDVEKDQLMNYTNESVPNRLPSNYLLAITEDRFGNLWVGSEYAGIIRIVKTPDYVKVVRPEINTIIGKTNNVRAIYEDTKGDIWVGTKNGSLYVYNSALTERIRIGENINPYALVEDDKQRMWVASKSNGVYLYDAKTCRLIRHFQHEPNDPSSLSSNVIFHVMKDNKNRIWTGSFIGGINLVEERGNLFSFRRFIQDQGEKSYIRYLYQDSKNRIWAGSSDGLIRFDPDELIANPQAYVSFRKNVNVENSLSSNDIKVIYEDMEKNIWIGTAGGGLNKYVEATDDKPEHFIAYTSNDGMVDNYVLGILEHDNDLWFSSENGLSRFSKDGKSIVTYQFSQKTFGNIYNEGAFLDSSTGEMLWGTLDGLLVFNPDKFEPDTYTPPVLITSMTVDGSDWNEIRKSSNPSITYAGQIELTHKQNTLSLEFATLNLRNPGENKYSYILKNYDKGWSIASHSNVATYKNLPPGKYTFKVMGANASGIWDDDVTSLRIVITPPFWKSTMAYLVYFVLLVLALYVTFKLILRFSRLNNAVVIEKQLTNHKLRFFTNISHEFRTPLTLIQGAVENLNDYPELPEPISKQVNVLNRNSLVLRRLIDQLLEFRKLQNNVLKLDLEELDMVTFSHDLYIGFKDLAEQKSIQYDFVTQIETLPMFIDRKKVDKVLYNLLSNAFKFAPKGGYVKLELTHDEEKQICLITVRDNGPGVPKDKQYLLFSRFAQIDFSTSGTGIGLSLVKEFVEVHKGKVGYEDNPEGGSVFSVELSTSRAIYEGENFVTDVHQNTVKEKTETVSSAFEWEDNTTVDSKILANYQLLIIEDNDDVRNFLVDTFSELMIVEAASDGKQGLERAIELNPDLIICDVMMPEMNGFEVTRKLKGEFQTCHIPIILLTAHSSIEHQLEGIESGADAYITKPFSLKYIVKRVVKLVEQREQLKKRFSKEFVIDGNLVNTTDKDKQFFDQIEKILDENFSNSEFTVDKFVELSGTRRTVFFKKVKGVTGFSPNELIKMKRLNRSAALLHEGELNVSEISYKVGFDDPYYFSKCFKAYFNCTPSKYKQNIEKK